MAARIRALQIQIKKIGSALNCQFLHLEQTIDTAREVMVGAIHVGARHPKWKTEFGVWALEVQLAEYFKRARASPLLQVLP